MATRDENLKKINDELEKLSDDELEQITGGNIVTITEKQAKSAGITLRYEDGKPGTFTPFWNFGDYYWRGNEISRSDAQIIVWFVGFKGRQPGCLEEARNLYKNCWP